VPSRYYTRATSSGCYWERQSGFGGTLGEIIANDFVGFGAPQIIVDIAASDKGFKTEAACGRWTQTPRDAPPPGSITPGWWLVNSQIQPGQYRTTASSGCYWERLRDFSGSVVSGVIANDFVSSGGQIIVQIGSADLGFHADAECGTWRPVDATMTFLPTRADYRQDPGSIARNRALRNARSGR
jgi:hypothetical protein